jgi:hypothetical protein
VVRDSFLTRELASARSVPCTSISSSSAVRSSERTTSFCRFSIRRSGVDGPGSPDEKSLSPLSSKDAVFTSRGALGFRGGLRFDSEVCSVFRFLGDLDRSGEGEKFSRNGDCPEKVGGAFWEDDCTVVKDGPASDDSCDIWEL